MAGFSLLRRFLFSFSELRTQQIGSNNARADFRIALLLDTLGIAHHYRKHIYKF